MNLNCLAVEFHVVFKQRPLCSIDGDLGCVLRVSTPPIAIHFVPIILSPLFIKRRYVPRCCDNPVDNFHKRCRIERIAHPLVAHKCPGCIDIGLPVEVFVL